MLARGPAAEILARHDERVRRNELVISVERDMSLGQSSLGGRDTTQRVLAELAILLRDGRIERQILRRNDLVGVDVVAQYIRLASDGRLQRHSRSLPEVRGQKSEVRSQKRG